jgi:SNF2 family DNA or RNA helicase
MRKKNKDNQGGGVVPPVAMAPITATSVAELQRLLNSIRPDTLPAKTLLDAVTRIYPSERTPPASSAFVTPLRHYQKQSLAFMIDTEESQVEWMNRLLHDDFATRGGWLCSDVGMGKTAVVVALVATKPIQESLLSTQIHGRVRLKATVVMTSVSLMSQWEDEVSKVSSTCFFLILLECDYLFTSLLFMFS